MPFKKKQKYSALPTSDEPLASISENEAPNEKQSNILGVWTSLLRGCQADQGPTIFVFAQTCVNTVWTLLLFIITILFLLSWNNKTTCHDYHDTDIGGARTLIARAPVKFTAGLYWNESTKDMTYRTWNEDEPMYVGPRTPELDAAWDQISLPLDIFITDEEARFIPDIPQGMYRDPKTGQYMAVVEAIHSLHCLNMLRQRIYIQDYPELASKPAMPNHIDHCIEALRQNLMCTADMTPAPLFYSEAIDKVQPNFEITHSCRNLRPLLEWARTRSVHQHSQDHHH